MKIFILIAFIIMNFGCAGNDSDLIQTPTQKIISSNKILNENVTNNKSQDAAAEDKLMRQNPAPRKNPQWIAGTFKGLRLGKSTEKDVRRLFGKPKYIYHPEDEYDNPIQSKLDYIYENEPQIIIDKKSGIVEEIWGADFSTFEEAVKKYGNGFYEVDFTKKGCVFKEYREQEKHDYPIYIAYPQNGFYFYITEKSNNVFGTYLSKCG